MARINVSDQRMTLARWYPNVVQSKRVDNNTLEFTAADGTTGWLHQSTLIAWHDEDGYHLNTGGWWTNTTKERMNSYLHTNKIPFTIYTQKGVWYVGDYRDWSKAAKRFVDNMTISLESETWVIEYPDGYERDQAEKDNQRAMVKAYCQALVKQIKENGCPMPDGGDCRYCAMTTQDGKSPGEATENTDHLISHLEEKYIMGSLIYRAVKEKGYRIPQLIMQENMAEQIGRAVKAYFNKHLGL